MDVLALLNQRSAALRSQTNTPAGNPSSYDPTDSDGSKTTSRPTSGQGRGAPRDTVDISSEARKASKSGPANKPGAYSAGNKDFDQVKRDMRGLIDTRLHRAETTLTQETNTATVKNLFGDITDRRALFAVYGDATETFNDAEKQAAKWLEQQLKKESYAKLPHNDKIIGLSNYLDQAGAEEKATFKWIEDRADAQAGPDGDLNGWRRLRDDGGVKTGDAAVDDLISRLTLNMLINKGSKTAHTQTGAYAQIKKDFHGLVDKNHTFTFTDATREASKFRDTDSPGDKNFDQVKRDMRKLIDARLLLAGTALTKETNTATIKSLFGDITDRRALFAVYGDATETFNDVEKKAAKWLELQLQKQAHAKLPKNDKIIGLTNYLDQASAEEKATFNWVKNRADAQAGLYGSLRGWQKLQKYGGVKTGDATVDDLISRLAINMLMHHSSKTDYTKTGAYAKIKKDFDGLVDRNHTFTFTDGGKPEGLIGFLNRADKQQRTQFHASRKQANTTRSAVGGTKNWWQNSAKNGIGGKNGIGASWWSSGGSRGVSNAIAMYNAALRTRRI